MGRFIKLTDEFVILLIGLFVNDEHLVNAVKIGKVSHVDKTRMQTLREQGFLAKSITHAYPHEHW